MLKKIAMPVKFKRFYKEYYDKEFTLLDIGCGNHSAQKTKHWFNGCAYYGLDRDNYNNDTADFALMEKFYSIDLVNEPEKVEIIPNDFFEIIVLNHVIEHLSNGLDIISALTSKLKAGGKIYIEFPSSKSLSLPNMYGSLNFSDDQTHVRVYSAREISNLLLAHNFRIVRAGVRKDIVRILLFPANIIMHLLKYRKLSGVIFWDITGFAEFVFAEKHSTLNIAVEK